MVRINIPTVGGSYKHDSLPFDAQKTVNMFVERGGAQSKAPGILRRFPGLELWTTVTNGTGAIRGMYVTGDDRAFICRGSVVIEVTTDKTVTVRLNLNSSFGKVVMTDNGIQLAVCDGTNIYYLTLATNAGTTVTDADAPDTTPVIAFLDSYIFGFNTSETNGSFRHSEASDVTSWGALDVYTAESTPDALVSLKAHGGQLWLFGSHSFEVWYNTGLSTGTTGNTWALIGGTSNNIGCAAAQSISSINGKLFWLGSSKNGSNIVWMVADGYTPVQISNKPLETKIASFADIDDSWAFSFEYEGHFFYALTFQTGDSTFVYDITEGEWTNWAYLNPDTGLQERHRLNDVIYWKRDLYGSDYANGKIYKLSKTAYTDNTDPISCERYFPHFQNLQSWITWHSLQIDIIVGTALISGQGSAPVFQLRWSDDGGYTWSNWHQVSMGSRGVYSTRAIIRMLGQSRTRVFHLRCSEPIPFSILDNTVAEISVSNI